MPLSYLRDGLPTCSTLTVTQLPCRAKLDQNESAVDLPEELKAQLLSELGRIEWNRYPQPSEYIETKKQFAQALNLDPETLSLTVGCDQAIQGAHFIAGGSGRRALVFEPTYPMLAHAGLMAGTKVERVMLGPDYDLQPDYFERSASLIGDVNLILIASPNNPTGSCAQLEVIEAALARPSYLFVDEAYFDLSRETVAPLLNDHPNLMIGRSCSKSLLAGMRLGYTMSHPEVTLRLDQLLTAPYHLSHAQLLLARRYADIRPHVEAAADRVIAERERLIPELEALGLAPLPSQANFLLLHLENAPLVSQGLAERGIRVRYAPKLPGLKNYLRITIGTAEENDLLLKELKTLI